MIRTLFVDDEPALLEGLENRLRRLRRRWSMSFVLGAKNALEVLDREPIDVVVSDMCMPGMDGAQFLARVRDTYPHTVRIILSGQTSHEKVLHALPVAHRFLSKPCDAAELERAVEGARALHSLLHDDRVRGVIGGVGELPSLPELYVELTEVVGRTDATASDVASVVTQDPAMTGRVLQLVNSSYFGLSRQITTATEAVAYLGANTIRALVLTVGLFGAFAKEGKVDGFSLQQLQRHSLRTARIASALLTDPEEVKTAYSAAILHDVGALVLATRAPDLFKATRSLAKSSGDAFDVCERALHGFGHAEVGAALLAVWGLPYSIVEAVALHHRPSVCSLDRFGVVAAIHVADRLVHEAEAAHGLRPPPRSGLDLEYLARLGVADRVESWRSIVQRLELGLAA